MALNWRRIDWLKWLGIIPITWAAVQLWNYVHSAAEPSLPPSKATEARVEAHPGLLALDGIVVNGSFVASVSVLNGTYAELRLERVEAELLDGGLNLIKPAATHLEGDRTLGLAAERKILVTAEVQERPCILAVKADFAGGEHAEKLFATSPLSGGRFLLMDASPVTKSAPASAGAQCK